MAACRAVMGLLSSRRSAASFAGPGPSSRACPARDETPAWQLTPSLASGRVAIQCRPEPPNVVPRARFRRAVACDPGARSAGPESRHQPVQQAAELALVVDVPVRAPDDAETAVGRQSRPD